MNKINDRIVWLNNIVKNNSIEFFLSAFSQIIYLLQTVIQNKIFTNFFSTNVFGEWSLLMSVQTLISMIPFTAFEQGVFKFAHQYREKDEEVFYSSITFVYILGFTVYIIFFGVGHIINDSDIFQMPYLMPFLIYVFTEIYKNTFVVIDNAYRNRKRVFIIRITEFVIRVLFMMILFILSIFTIKNVLIIMILSNILTYIIQSPLFSKIHLKIDWSAFKKIWNEIIIFAMPLLIWAIFGWMQNMISRCYLGLLLDYESVAMYSVLTSISFFVPNAIYAVINTYIMPIAFTKSKGFTRIKMLKYISLVGGIMVIYFVFILFGGKYLLLILTAEKYLTVLKYLPFTTASSIIYVLAMLSTVEIYRRGETKKLLFSTILPGVLMSTVGYFLINTWGIFGAVINYIMGHCVYASFTFIVVFNKKNLSRY